MHSRSLTKKVSCDKFIVMSDDPSVAQGLKPLR